MPSLLRPLLLLSVLFFLGSGLVATLFHWAPVSQPFHTISLLSYSTMAPFQGFVPENGAIVADGLQKGDVWIPLALESYLPLPQGERSAWIDLGSLALTRSPPFDDPSRLSGYRRMAELLLLQERRKGNPLSALRLLLETWPVSPEDYLAQRHPPFTQRTLLVQVP